MKKSEIEINGEYRVEQFGNRGRAIVTGPPVKQKYSNVYSFPVEFPDNLKDGKPDTALIESRRFLRPWMPEDDERFQKSMMNAARRDDLQERLEAAGFSPDVIRHIRDDDFLIQFRGEESQRVIEILTKERV